MASGDTQPAGRADRGVTLVLHVEADARSARELCEALVGYGVAAQGLTLARGDIAAAQAMGAAIEVASGVVAIWSLAAEGDPLMLDVAGVAKDAGKLVPVRLQAVEPPLGFRQLQTADLTAFPGPDSALAVSALATALLRLEDGTLKRFSPRDSERLLGIRRFLVSGNFWGGSALMALLLGLAYALTPSGLALAQGENGDRAPLLTAGVTVGFMALLVILARALLHASRRIVGMQTPAFFSTEYAKTLAVGFLSAAGLLSWRQGFSLDGADVGFLGVVAIGVGGLVTAFVVFAFRVVRRLAFGRVQPTR